MLNTSHLFFSDKLTYLCKKYEIFIGFSSLRFLHLGKQTYNFMNQIVV